MAHSEDILIRLKGVGKDYPTAYSAGERIATLFALIRGAREYPRFSALSDISFEIRRGESFGVIGENGAGKSTLLKIIAGVVQASHGTVSINARVGALLELGAGFHPEYSGRDNIFLSAALMGMSRPEVVSKIDSILAFADIGSHIDQPIKHYSSGMVVRLGFAVATAMRPDVLITDEVLAVGDESFQKKCIAWMEDYLSGGGTLLLCSHGMYHVQKLCKRALWIHQGQARMGGDVFDVTQAYLAYHQQKDEEAKSVVGTVGHTTSEYSVKSLALRSTVNAGAGIARIGDDICLDGTVLSPDGRPPCVAIGILRSDGIPVYGTMNEIDGTPLVRTENKLYRFSFWLEKISLLPGHYVVRAHAMDPEGMRIFDTMEIPLQIIGQTREVGIVRLAHRWNTDASFPGRAS